MAAGLRFGGGARLRASVERRRVYIRPGSMGIPARAPLNNSAPLGGLGGGGGSHTTHTPLWTPPPPLNDSGPSANQELFWRLWRQLVCTKITSKRVVRSSAGAYAIYPPFLGSFA